MHLYLHGECVEKSVVGNGTCVWQEKKECFIIAVGCLK